MGRSVLVELIRLDVSLLSVSAGSFGEPDRIAQPKADADYSPAD